MTILIRSSPLKIRFNVAEIGMQIIIRIAKNKVTLTGKTLQTFPIISGSYFEMPLIQNEYDALILISFKFDGFAKIQRTGGSSLLCD